MSRDNEQRIRTDTYVRMSHVTGLGCVLVSLRFGCEPESGPVITVRSSLGKVARPSLDVERYLQEVLEGVSEVNKRLGADLDVEEIQIVPDDYPTEGQVRYCATKLAEHTINSEQGGGGQAATRSEST